jgi:GDP-L-fucose synthase
MKKNSRIFIADQSGIVGQALRQRLKEEGFKNLLPRSPSQLDLLDQKSVSLFFERNRPEYCFLPSTKEGGIKANIKYPADLIYYNLVIQNNIISSAYESKVKKLIFFASSCVYPKNCPQPMKERYLLTGPLEPTNESYALAKISGIKMCQAYNRQFATQFVSVIPATIYGPNDNFDLNVSHVVPALIRKFHEAKVKNKPSVIIWGSGKPRREFIYSADLADACIFVMSRSILKDVINIGTGIDIPIKKLAELIKDIVAFRGAIKFDANKPDGAYRKLLDNSRLRSLGWRPKTDIYSGLYNTYRWYERNA